MKIDGHYLGILVNFMNIWGIENNKGRMIGAWPLIV
jgi:hypothetical protein